LPDVDRHLARLKPVRVLADDADLGRSRRNLTRDWHTVFLIVIIAASMTAAVAIVISTPAPASAPPASGAVVVLGTCGPAAESSRSADE
jgi:hypothetical protein